MSDPTTVRKLNDLERRLAALAALERPYSRVGARVYNAANISAANGASTLLTFNSERYDLAGLHSTSVNTGRLTAPVAGRYAIVAHVTFDTNATGNRQVLVEVNGATLIAADSRNAVSGSATHIAVATEYELAAGDYVQVYAFQNSGGALNVLALSNFSPEFAIHLLG